MFPKKLSLPGVSRPINLSGRNESSRAAEETRRADPHYLEALTWINGRRRPNERRDEAVKVLANVKPGQDVPLNNLALTSLPESLLTRASTAKSISLSGNGLPAIPQAILNFSALRGLDLSFNELTALPLQIGQMENLRSLDASHNAIPEVPASIGRLSKLESLNLGDNALRTLPAKIGNLSKLKQLKLGGNMLDSLPPTIVECAGLQELDISRNHFDMVPHEVGRLSKLRTLKADRNQLTDLEPNEDDPDGVHNRAIPESIGTLRNLEHLDVAGNPLNTLPNSFGPFEYVSQRRFEITRQGKNTLTSKLSPLSTNLRIRIANTPLPATLPSDGRLKELPGGVPEPVYERLYTKESHRPEANEAFSPDASPQRPIPHMTRAMPELFAAQTAAGPSGAGAFDQFVRQAAGQASGFPPGGPAAQATATEQPFEHLAPQQRSETIPAGQASMPVPTPAPQAQFGANAQAVPAQAAQPFTHAQMGGTLPRGGMPPNAIPPNGMPPNGMRPNGMPFNGMSFNGMQPNGMPPNGMPFNGMPPNGVSQAAQSAAAVHGQMGATFAPPPIPQPAPAPTPAHPYQPMPAGMSFPGARGFAPTTQDPQAAAYAQALQIATALMQRSSMPQVHSAPMRATGVNNSWFDYSNPAINQAHQHELDRLGFEQVQHNTLAGLSKHYRERLYLQGPHLTQRLEQAKLRGSMGITGETVGLNVWRVGIMMFRQHVICNLAETVANINREKKLTDPSQSHLADDPLQIALVYQTIASRELQILGLEPLRDHLDTPQFKSMFRHIVSPELTDSVRQGIVREVLQAEQQNEGATVSAFINEQPFWKEYLESQQSAANAAWRGTYGF